jgi:trimethylamine corrinoid protein
MHKGNEKLALETIERALAEGYDPVEILSDGFSAGIREVGDLFSRGSVFLPQLMMTADVMQKVSARVDEAVASGGQAAEKKGIMVLATVEGDVHDIGKGIVASLVKTQGIEVIDLGRDVPVATIVEKAQQYKADIIGTSALLTTTMNEQKKLEELLKSQGLRERFKTMIGGAPATQRWADRIGADAYAEDAGEAVTKALALLS